MGWEECGFLKSRNHLLGLDPAEFERLRIPLLIFSNSMLLSINCND